MGQNHEDLSVVIKRFPEHANDLERHYRKSSRLKNICEDYRKCLNALNYWALLKNEEAVKPHGEYAALLFELEFEIIRFLEEHQ
ncbi:hypothetical protein JCM14469_40240 [Desulfatiferula olefinivorans]